MNTLYYNRKKQKLVDSILFVWLKGSSHKIKRLLSGLSMEIPKRGMSPANQWRRCKTG